MHPMNARALAPVIADVDRTAAPAAAIDEEDWGAAVPAIVLRGTDGGTAGFLLDPDASAAERQVDAADHVQDQVVDALHALGASAAWPACPIHSATHPLTAAVVEGAAVWRCPVQRTTVAAIGSLPPVLQRGWPVRPAADEQVDPVLATALAPVLRDLAATRGPAPRIGRGDSGHPDLQSTAMIWSEDGRGRGVGVALEADPDAQVVEATETVQEWAIEALWFSGRSATWPVCPLHPLTHPLRPEPQDGAPSWICPVTTAVIAPVGGLTAPSGPPLVR